MTKRPNSQFCPKIIFYLRWRFKLIRVIVVEIIKLQNSTRNLGG